VLDGIDLDARDGEIVALLGTNGSGKSTLLDAIAGVHRPSRGRVTIDGIDTTGTRAERLVGRGVAEAPADHGVFPSLTVHENLRLARWRVRDRAESRVALAGALELFPRLEERSRQRAGDLSGGEQHMLTLAMALAAAPRLLLIDELSLGLAPEATRRVQERLRSLRDDGVAIVVVEQSIDRAIALADRAVFLDGGTVRYAGEPRGLLERPDLVRATFLGAAADVTSARERSARVSAHGGDAPPGPPALELRDLRVRFGGVDALDGVSLSVARGEIVGVIGPNGAGKTTLFDAVSGFSRLDAGSVTLRTDTDAAPRDVTRLAPHARASLGLGRSFQDGRLFPALTVRETIAVACERAVRVRNPIAAALHLPAVGRSEAAIGARVDELVERLHLGPYADRFGHELSTGTRRVVDLACVLAHDPAVLLLDEPAAGVAQREAEALGPLLAEVRDSLDAAVLVVEHDLGVLGDVADRIVALDRGRVVADGPPDVVLADPAVTGA
jgi:branched-chain amino acid transport system ATP-binding protein